MTASMQGLLALVVVLSLATSFLMSGMEAGVFALSRLRIRRLMRRDNRRAAALNGYLEKPEHFLWTILVGNTLANLIAVSAVFLALERWLGGRPVLFWLVLALGGVVFYTLLELLPKMLFRHHPNRLCMAMVPAFTAIELALRPLVGLVALFAQWLLVWTGGRRFTGQLFGNRDELRQVMLDSAQGLTSEERTMISRVLDLQNMTVQEIALPLAKAIAVSAETTVAEMLARCREKGVSRLPVWRMEAGAQRIAGLVSLHSLLYAETVNPAQKAGDFLKPALFLDEGQRVEAAFRQMQRTGQRLAIVLDRHRREVGLVSIEDILKVIFGEVNL